MPLTIARQVIGPTIPSEVVPTAVWKPRTKRSVSGPKIPSTCVRSPSPLERSWNTITSCTARTASPRLPRLTWTTRRGHVLGPTMPAAPRPLLRWKVLTADSVAGPKIPSTATRCPRARRSRCSGRTGKILFPRFTSGQGAIGSGLIQSPFGLGGDSALARRGCLGRAALLTAGPGGGILVARIECSLDERCGVPAGSRAHAERSRRQRQQGGTVERHGSESYFVIGEGLLGESLGGREETLPRTMATAAPAPPPPSRFRRRARKTAGTHPGDPNRRKIALAMTPDNLQPGTIPAGFTYLGQFVDHDLSFDTTELMEGVDIKPADLLSARSPSLDLDCLYGLGPQDPGSAKFYEADGLHLKMGSADGGPAGNKFDLPRVGVGTPAAKRLSLSPEKRDDQNLAVGQLHLAMIRFHNRVVDTLPAAVPPAQRFTEARKKVVMHYQWMLRSDYLPRICAPAVVTNVFNQGGRAFEVNALPDQVPTMPVEFSVADFRRLFNFGQITPPPAPLVVPATKFNRAMRIDTRLVNPLRQLRVPDPNPRKNLAFRNLARANMVKLATGQQMATFLIGKGVQLTRLTKPQIRNGANGAKLDALTVPQRNALLANTPLWFYILRESELNNGRLKGVGARIVAELFHRAMEASKNSIVREPTFRPSLGPNNTTFRMVDLLFFAFQGQAALLNPNGN